MSVRALPLFAAGGRGTPLLFAQWVNKGAAQPIMTSLRLVDGEGIATPDFRSLWAKAFPTRPPLPQGMVAQRNGTATDDFWFVFS
jgi:hypothetical protein